jgi:hypothetical protein
LSIYHWSLATGKQLMFNDKSTMFITAYLSVQSESD